MGRAEYDIQLNVLELVGHALLPPELGKTIITVHHGPVIYDDQPATVINCIPELQRGRALPFFKGTRFAGQREYRFVVLAGGEPNDEKLCVPVSHELRDLASSEDCSGP